MDSSIKTWTDEDNLLLESKVYMYGGDVWDRLAQEFGTTPGSVYYHWRRIKPEEYNSRDLADILDISPMAARTWIKSGFLGPRRWAFRPNNRSVKHSGSKRQQYWKVLGCNVRSFLGDPWYGWLIRGREIRHDFRDWVVPQEDYWVTWRWFCEHCEGISAATAKRWITDNVVPAFRLPGGIKACPRAIAQEHIRMLNSDYPWPLIKRCNWAMVREIYKMDDILRVSWRKPLGMSHNEMVRLVVAHNGRF